MDLILFIGFCVLYFLPAIIANRKKHQSENMISMVNLILGWTVVGWLLCLAWACDGKKEVNA